MITRFSDFIGNERTVQSVQAMLSEQRVPQTLVIEGPEGSGRKTFARLLAAGLMCGEAHPPCGACERCRSVLQQSYEDVAVITPQDGKAAIGVEAIRQVRLQAYIRPGQGNRKVFVVAGKMNDAAQNAFLKILEEPPAGVYFLLLCGHRSELIETVLSRAVVLTLGSVTYEQALPYLNGIGMTDVAAFEQSGGLLGRLQQEEQNTELARVLAGCCRAVATDARQDFLQAIAPIMDDRTLYPRLLTGLYELTRDALVCQTGRSVTDENARLLARRLTKENLLALGTLLSDQQKKLPYNPNGWLFFTALCAAIFPRR